MGESGLKKGYLFTKRIMDIVLSATGLIVLSPVFLVIAAAIKMEDGGSIFYMHDRVGLNGKIIKILKFRSMTNKYIELEKVLSPEQLRQYKTEFKIDNDPRITKIGNILRRYSLDELPQLWDAFTGKLSLVGPRPLVLKETYIYGEKRSRLLSVKPGITGYWQVNGRSDSTYASGKRQELELYYVDNASIILDLYILFKTVYVVLKKEGAR